MAPRAVETRKGKRILAKITSGWETFKKQFPKGARVQLKVGGPEMVVNGYFEATYSSLDTPSMSEQIICQWFSGKKLESGRFAPETLVLVKDATGEKES
jgi:uncharacterized protein YodC (DUF2158 family)